MGKEQSPAHWLWETWQQYLASRTLSDEGVRGWIEDLLKKTPEELNSYLRTNCQFRATIGNIGDYFIHHSVPDAKPDFEVFTSPPFPNPTLPEGNAYHFAYYSLDKKYTNPDGFLRFWPRTDKNEGHFRFNRWGEEDSPVVSIGKLKQIPEIQKLIQTVKQGAESGVVGLVHYNQTGRSGWGFYMKPHVLHGEKGRETRNWYIAHFRHLQIITGMLAG